MKEVLLVVHLILSVVMVGVILIQRSEGGGLGIGGGGMGSFMGARGTANLLTRTTAILAGCFFLTTLVLTILMTQPGTAGGGSALDDVSPAAAVAPAKEPAAPVAGSEPAKPAAPEPSKPAEIPASTPAETPAAPAPAETPAPSAPAEVPSSQPVEAPAPTAPAEIPATPDSPAKP